MDDRVHLGSFFVIEGPDGCGKTTSGKLVVDRLLSSGYKAEFMSFPNRTTEMGKRIDKYLKKELELTPLEAKMLFSLNRWECMDEIKRKIAKNIIIVCDRYIYSGIVYSHVVSKESIEECAYTDKGLLTPNLTFYISADAVTCIENIKRSGKTGERYESVNLLDSIIKAYPLVFAKIPSPIQIIEYGDINDVVGQMTKTIETECYSSNK